VEAFLQYNENTVERGLFYQALNVLEVTLDDELELDDYEANFRRMFGNPRMDAVIGSVAALLRPDADEHETGRAGQAPAPDRQLPKTAHGAARVAA
jgi:hypothetical protein